MIDKLNKPLAGKRGKKTKSTDTGSVGPRLPMVPISLGLLAIAIATPIAWINLVDNPDGGRPVADVEVNSVVDSNELARNLTAQNENTEPSEPISSPSVEVIEGNEPLVISTDGLPDSDESQTIGARADMLEMSQHGNIPQIGPNGERPADVYRRPAITVESANGRPLVAVIVTGLGLNFDSTSSAIAQLPDDVTLAFAPYGKKVAEAARRARQGGHEIMLQVPLEPFDYPQNDPGPHTLLVGQSARANLDRLYWLMSRIEGYTGVINHLGAKFTSASADFEPVMEELGLRGLAYVDDGTSNRSVARQLAMRSGAPFALVNMALDDNPSRGTILAQLERLEQMAREKNTAIGVITALPISVRTLVEWTQTLEDKGITLVPVSALFVDQIGQSNGQ
jgi:polysaccharide deacetylase 2 family uncharacterized protein YibQ